MGGIGRTLIGITLVFSNLAGVAQLYQNQSDFMETASGLKYKITEEGSGDFPKAGDQVWVHFTARFDNDSIYDSSLERGPLDAYLSSGQLIKGWEEGLRLIKPGGSIILVVPPELAYGNKKHNQIPAQSTLIFEIALLQVNASEAIEPFVFEGLKQLKAKKKIRYYLIDEGQGPLAKLGDNAYVHYTGFLPDGSLFDTSRKKGDPVRITVGINQVMAGWDMGLLLMRKGSKIKLLIPAKQAYGSDGFGTIVPPNSDIILDLEMVDLVPPVPVSQWDISDKKVVETPSGLKYVVFDPGKGDLIQKENIVTVHYSGYLTDGTLFDSSVKRFEPIRIPVGVGAVIDAWDEGLTLMRKGARFQLWVPSGLAYGEEGAPPQIAPNADLIFDIEVIDILK